MMTGAQTLGGNAVYSFLKLPASPLQTAAGGLNVSYVTDDAGLGLHNPATMNAETAGKLALHFNSFFAGAKAFHLAGVFKHENSGTMLGGGIHYIDYGSIPQTDASGNQQGSFRPRDYMIQASAARTYLERWQYGATLRFIHSGYGAVRSSGLAMDAGLLYRDSANGFSAGLLVQHMGAQLTRYGSEREELPFDLQAGITKRLPKAPFGFSLTLQQLHRFNITYNDTVFNNENGFAGKKDFVSKVLHHFILATHIYIGPQVEATVGYNFLRRHELNIGNAANGLNGFSAGLRARYSALQFQYARAWYQRGGAYNQLGLQLSMDRIMGRKSL